MAVSIATPFVMVSVLLQVFGLFIHFTSGTPTYVKYEIPNKPVLSSEPRFSLEISSLYYRRFRRDVENSGGNGTIGFGVVEPDNTPTVWITTHSLSNQSAQSVTQPSVDISTPSTTPISFTTPSTLAAKSSVLVTTAQVQTTERFNNESSSPSENPFEDADIIHDHYEYYTSKILKNKISDHWVELENAPRHETLSSGHRVAAVINLKFDFYFYGHKVTNVTIATGGFIYMSPFLHQWLTVTQYIAPLMANFDPSISKNSSIYYQSEKDRFIVEWKDIMLKEQTSKGRFHFQTILSNDDSIKFVYKSIPYPVTKITTEDHPVKVGVSDAYYNDTYIPKYNMKRRTIYEYHKVALPMATVMTGSVIILTPLPTCNRLLDCTTCVTHVGVKFDCRWCNTIGRCSDGLDWYRQHWDREGCQRVGNKCNRKDEFPVAVVIILLLIICGLLASVAGWVIYAYKNPTSKSGMWLLEHRPSQMRSRIKFWKSSSDNGTKYKVVELAHPYLARAPI